MGAKITIYLKDSVKAKHLEGIVKTIRMILGSWIVDLKVGEEPKWDD